jgi:hypothetical protein
MKLGILAALIPVLLLASVMPVVSAELSPDEVQKAMHKGVAYLKDQWQTNRGHWSEYGGQEGGITCLCTMALLNAGEKPGEQPYLKSALEKVRNLRPKTTYVVALQTMVLCRADQFESDQDLIRANAEWLQEWQIKDHGANDRRGGWSYGENPVGPQGARQGDGSNSQFALLALYEAARAAEKHHLHIKISRETWELARNYWIVNQRESDGGWGYYKTMDPTGSMTCAGISSLVICSDMLHEPDAKVSGDSIDGCFRASSEDRERINKGIDWLRRYFSVQANPPSAAGNVRLWHYYYLYGLERAGRLSARRKIGEHDWYREGSYHLVHTINADLLNSSWRGSGFAETDPDITTSLALLFLSKGRWPALMGKVQFGRSEGGRIRDADKHWNWHRNDVNNLTIDTEAHWGFEMTWQEIDINKADVDELLQVPVLFFSGNGSPLPETKEQRQRLAEKLRDYIDRGNFIFADGGEACEAGASEFDTGFRQLMDLVFQKPEYRFKPLDASHPVWRADEQIKPDQSRLLLGIDYGCRTSVIYAPFDPNHPQPSLAALWDLSRSGQKDTYSKSVLDQIHGGLAIGRNVLTYATNRELKGREYSFQNKVTKIISDKDRGKFAIAKLIHMGGCDAAPRALANLMEQSANDLHIRVEAHPKMLSITDPALMDYAVVFMHGRNAFRLTELERQALREYIERGGVLFADAICGSEPFAESFRNEMAAIFPKDKLMSIPGNDPIWTTKYGGYDLSLVTRRDPQPGASGEGMKSTLRRVPPEFKAVRIGDRYGVIFSEFDLSCALEKHDSLECRGYTRDDAARIGINIIRYAMQQ